MKKIYKKITVIILLIIISLTIPFYSKAAETEDEEKSTTSLNMTEIMNGAKDFINKSNDDPIFNAVSERSAIDTIYYIGLTLAIIIAVVVGMILGIQFITSGVEGQAKVKEKLIPFFVGCFVVFGAYGIWRIVYNVLNAGFAD